MRVLPVAASPRRGCTLRLVNAKPRAPGSQAALREANRCASWSRPLRDQGAMTQVELVGATGLSAATVSNLVTELGSAGAAGAGPEHPQRPPGRARLARGPRDAPRRHRLRRPRRAGGGRRPARATGDRPAADAAAGRPPRGRGHGARGTAAADLVEKAGKTMADVGGGRRHACPRRQGDRARWVSESILPGWRGVAGGRGDAGAPPGARPWTTPPTSAALGRAEMRCAARGSARRATSSCRYGVGAGLILGGELFRGRAGTAGEIGHLTIDENGPVCRCGNRGCLETYIGARGLLEALAASHGPLEPARRHRPRPRRRRRLPAGPRGRRTPPRGGRRRPGQPAQPRGRSSLGGQLATVGADHHSRPMRASLERCAIPSAAALASSCASGELDDGRRRGRARWWPRPALLPASRGRLWPRASVRSTS